MDFKILLTISLIIVLKSPKVFTQYSYPDDPQYRVVVRQLFSYLDKNRLKSFVQKFSSFHNRHSSHRDGEAERWLNQEIMIALSHYNAGPTFLRKIGTNRYRQQNYIAKLEGHDPDLQQELVILGAHYDTYNYYGNERAPGADDNATGCAVLLEVLRLAAKFKIKFKRTIEFHWYTGKESDKIFGSEDVVKKYKAEGIHLKSHGVKGMLNLDTLGYQPYSSEKRIGIVNRYGTTNGGRSTSVHLTSFVERLVEWYLDRSYRTRELQERDRTRIISDNYAWYRAGYNAAFVTEADSNIHLHNDEDTTNRINFDQVKEFAKLALGFVIELGELSEKLVVTEPPLMTEGPEMTTETAEPGEGSSTETSMLERNSREPSEPDESFAVKRGGDWSEISVCLAGIWLLH